MKKASKKLLAPSKHKPEHIVIAAMGRLDMPFIIDCLKANFPFVIANHTHMKRFAGAIGQLTN
jgi:transposase